jgi:hypothetical protein
MTLERDFEAERLFDPVEWSDFFAYAARIHEAATKHASPIVVSMVSFEPSVIPYACVRAAPSSEVRA